MPKEFTPALPSKIPVWQGTYCRAFALSEPAEKTILQFRIPYTADEEAILLTKFQMSPGDRLPYYETLVKCIQRELSVSEYLKHSGIPSILYFEDIYQEQQDGVTSIFLQSEPIWPIKERLLRGAVSKLTVLDVFLRLLTILRDLAKVGVTHRGIDMNEVYLNASDHILLGGFYYADCPGMDTPPPYLPEHPKYLPDVFLQGETGSLGTDAQTVFRLMYNAFSGLPIETLWRNPPNIQPEYASEELTDLIFWGLQCKDQELNPLRRKLSGYRKVLAKTAEAKERIPILEALLPEYKIEYI